MVVAEGGVLRNVKRDECNPAEGSRQEGDESPCRQHIPEGTSVSFAASDPPVRALVASVHVPHPRGRENEEGKRSEGRPMNQHLGTHEQTSEHAEKKQSPSRRVAEPLQLVIELSKEPDLVRRARRARRACSCGRHRTRRGLLGTPTCLHYKQPLGKNLLGPVGVPSKPVCVANPARSPWGPPDGKKCKQPHCRSSAACGRPSAAGCSSSNHRGGS
ncbi:hypothetical protein GGP42_002042 [Salinibacter ruber]|nr:hypothetical protein [Salinibacter ruber]